jgi:uncharacterized membrane-anchored protein YitT (DUF2179 family)
LDQRKQQHQRRQEFQRQLQSLSGAVQERGIDVTVTRRRVLAQTLRLIKEADPRAFTYVTDSTEVHGEGFRAD